MPPAAGMGAHPQTYVALLRGINLGARNKIAMPRLRALFTALGCEDVETYVQSGNVVFRSRAGSAAELTRSIEEQIAADLGLEIAVLLRTGAEMRKVAAGNPFPGYRGEPTLLHVTFLAETPARDRVGQLDPQAAAPDELRVVGREVYLHCPNGYGRSRLSNTYFEKQLGVVATTRNWRTVTTLAELAGA